MSCGGSMGKKKMAKGGSTKKLVKAQNGLFKKKTWTNTVSPDEETVLSTRPGMRGSTVNVITDAKTGKKIDRYRTPGLTRKQEKANEMYAKNPVAAKEDDFVPFTTRKKGGAMKSYKTGGSTGIVGMPLYDNNPRVQPFKKGGAKKTKYAKGGSTGFGMLSVKAGIDKNPKPTAADRIAGAKMKMKKRKSNGK